MVPFNLEMIGALTSAGSGGKKRERDTTRETGI
jgi:hypothetical protein